MERNLRAKFIFIIVLVVVAFLILYPPTKTLKPGIDLKGGTSLIYGIDTEGLSVLERRGLSTRMINVLKRRVDPANFENLEWRPQGNTRLEIRMPLASAKARSRRRNYDKAKRELLDENIYPAVVIRCLEKPAEERAEDFNDFARGEPNRLAILETLATSYDERKELREKRSGLAANLKSSEVEISGAGLDVEQMKVNLGGWARLGEEELTNSLRDFLGSDDSVNLLTKHVKTYSEWLEVDKELTDAESGKNVQYEDAERQLYKLNLSEDQIDLVLSISKSRRRKRAVEDLKIKFADRADKIGKLADAFNKYRKFRGRLDDPKDLQRMLKGAGVLEFRILPTLGHAKVDSDEVSSYVETLRARGPKYASTGDYVWCEIEDIDEWRRFDEEGRPYVRYGDGQGHSAVIAPFGEKYYVLASNQRGESLLHDTGEQRSWKLERARPTTRDMERAIGFVLDERGGKIFYRVTKNNPDRPLCILLDGLAISAPKITARGGIGRRGEITGDFSKEQQEDMVNKLNAGTLPGKLIEQPIAARTIGPSMGASNRDKGIIAGFIGLFVVVFCMLVYYMVAGSIADTALLMNILFVLATMAFVRATFTLPGIAGIILTVGMSVDANVLIFERIREEQQKGSSLRIAIRNGYQRAFRTIFDANVTTFITAAILCGVASEEIRGFAIVLMLGIAWSMFTALFVTRVIFDYLLAKRLIKDRLSMLCLISKPNVNWMGLRRVFFSVSVLLIGAGLFVFFTRDDAKNNKYDIEFTGGTSVVITLKEDVELSRQDVEHKVREIGESLGNPALAAARVNSIGKAYKEKLYTQYEINTTETNKTVTGLTFPQGAQWAVDSVISAVKKTERKVGGSLSNLVVTRKNETNSSFVVTTSQLNKSVVKNILRTTFAKAEISEPESRDVVSGAIREAFEGKLETQENLQPKISSQEKITGEVVESFPELGGFPGGIKITCEIGKAVIGEEIDERFRNLRVKSDIYAFDWYRYSILDLNLKAMDPNQPVSSFVYVSAEPEAAFRKLTEDEWERFVGNETNKVLTAVSLEASFLPTQFDPSVGAEQKDRAQRAIVLSLFAIIGYIWLRFGNFRYGIAAIIALVHDVCITLGAVSVCTYIARTSVGEMLLIGDFKINLAMIAAFLTLIGYSLNDTIVVFDRIRENRRKGRLNAQIITDSINQTISRTLLTSFTTFIVVLIMYIFGGAGLRGFTFAIGFGIIVGTYSSIAIAAPVLLLGATAEKETRK